MVRNLLPKRLENLIDQGAKLGFATRSALRKAAKTAIKGKFDKHVKTASHLVAVSRGAYFDESEALRVVDFIETLLVHSKGDYAGQPFILIPWQKFDVIYPVFGWRRKSGVRLYRRAYIEVPKKNGKSTFAAALEIYLCVGDREIGAEVYSAATTTKQASIVYSHAEAMIKASPALASKFRLQTSKKLATFPATNSKIEALSSDVEANEGWDIHGLIIDELHAWKDRTFWETLRYGGAARSQPLSITITTAGVDRNSICYEQHQYAEAIIKGEKFDPSFFGVIYAADKKDDPMDPKTWFKANPSLGYCLDLEQFEEDALEASNSPTKVNSFKRYRLNIWTQSIEGFINLVKWGKCAGKNLRADLRGCECYVGLDLASVSDLAAAVFVFPYDDGGFAWIPFFWIPEESAHEREKRDGVAYRTWGEQGHLSMTPGARIDQKQILRDILELAKEFDIREIAVDRWNAEWLVHELDDEEIEVSLFGQGFRSMNEPTKKLEALVLGYEIEHPDNPVLNWCIANLCIEKDAADNYKPSKRRSKEKIDGAVGGIMGMGTYLMAEKDSDWLEEDEEIKTV